MQGNSPAEAPHLWQRCSSQRQRWAETCRCSRRISRIWGKKIREDTSRGGKKQYFASDKLSESVVTLTWVAGVTPPGNRGSGSHRGQRSGTLWRPGCSSLCPGWKKTIHIVTVWQKLPMFWRYDDTVWHQQYIIEARLHK